MDAINGTDPGHAPGTDVADVDLGPLSITGDASTECSQSEPGDVPFWVTCTSRVGDFNLSVDGETVIAAGSLFAKSTSTNDGTSTASDSDGTTFDGLCIVQNAGDACTPITEGGVYDIAGTCDGTVRVQGEKGSSTEGAQSGSGLTVTMLHLDCATVEGTIVLEIGQAHSFVAGPVVPPPAAPTVTPAQLPITGGPGNVSSNIGWYLLVIGLALLGAIVLFAPRTRRVGARSDHNSNR